jgi:hypothetical protein
MVRLTLYCVSAWQCPPKVFFYVKRQYAFFIALKIGIFWYLKISISGISGPAVSDPCRSGSESPACKHRSKSLLLTWIPGPVSARTNVSCAHAFALMTFITNINPMYCKTALIRRVLIRASLQKVWAYPMRSVYRSEQMCAQSPQQWARTWDRKFRLLINSRTGASGPERQRPETADWKF